MELEFDFAHLLLTIGSETCAGLGGNNEKPSDAALLRNQMVLLLEEASLEKGRSEAQSAARLRYRWRRFRWP